jgi:uncharacterized membrane protein
MKYVVVSRRVGVPGTQYDTAAAEAKNINVAGLIAGGFIVAVEESTPKATKPRKVKSTTKE